MSVARRLGNGVAKGAGEEVAGDEPRVVVGRAELRLGLERQGKQERDLGPVAGLGGPHHLVETVRALAAPASPIPDSCTDWSEAVGWTGEVYAGNRRG